MESTATSGSTRGPWKKGKLVGQKAPPRLKDISGIRVRLQLTKHTRELAMINLAIDSKLCGCDVVKLRVNDVSNCARIAPRAIVMQQKTHRPVQLEIADGTPEAVSSWVKTAGLGGADYLFPRRLQSSPHLSKRRYARMVASWVRQIGLDPYSYGTHTMRRTKPTLIYRRAENLRAVQLLLGNTKLESTARFLASRWATRLNGRAD